MVAYLALAIALLAVFLALTMNGRAKLVAHRARRRERLLIYALAGLYRTLPSEKAAAVVSSCFRTLDPEEAAALAEILGCRDPSREAVLEHLEAQARIDTGEADDPRRQLILAGSDLSPDVRQRFIDEVQRSKVEVGPTLLDIAVNEFTRQ